MHDIRFHQCARLQAFESKNIITFIPPDGEFELMSYRLDTKVLPLISIKCLQNIKSHSHVECIIRAKSEFKHRFIANNVEIFVPVLVPLDAGSLKFRVSLGSAEYVPQHNYICWTIKQLYGQKECLMHVHFDLPRVSAVNTGQKKSVEKIPIRVNFEIPYLTASGIQVRRLKIVEKSGYQPLSWIRYTTQSGDYQIRM
ncbi:hypothetical protein RFI_11918 [Reticulomyxa filosa]|uniref:MHD domain-containing protein n=1 Tax=Reticulomyxa filosa TaxID=46433 RepID=X6NFW8_RETFI|nr:hypothetical protein RFI_11918 [Reticulomyxa filosa]|eukprot:ETO25220.1 hypothetical protein RFI_11918 [Reticulomyxa filosa]